MAVQPPPMPESTAPPRERRACWLAPPCSLQLPPSVLPVGSLLRAGRTSVQVRPAARALGPQREHPRVCHVGVGLPLSEGCMVPPRAHPCSVCPLTSWTRGSLPRVCRCHAALGTRALVSCGHVGGFLRHVWRPGSVGHVLADALPATPSPPPPASAGGRRRVPRVPACPRCRPSLTLAALWGEGVPSLSKLRGAQAGWSPGPPAGGACRVCSPRKERPQGPPAPPSGRGLAALCPQTALSRSVPAVSVLPPPLPRPLRVTKCHESQSWGPRHAGPQSGCG